MRKALSSGIDHVRVENNGEIYAVCKMCPNPEKIKEMGFHRDAKYNWWSGVTIYQNGDVVHSNILPKDLEEMVKEEIDFHLETVKKKMETYQQLSAAMEQG